MGERVIRARRILVGGGIGAGKSVVLDALARAGYDTVQADRIGHRLLEPGGAAEAEVVSRWPSVVGDGSIRRDRLATIVFADPGELAALESITHPLIVEEIRKRSDSRGATPLAVEIPIPGLVDDDGWIRVAVIAPEDTRVERAVERGGSEADVRARIANQATESQWREWADIVIANRGSIGDVQARVRSLIGGDGL